MTRRRASRVQRVTMGKDKRMDAFARETFKLGTLRGFRHFTCELRGREEMMVTIEVPTSRANRLTLAPMSLQNALPPASPCQREPSPPVPWADGGGASSAPASPSKPSGATRSITFLVAGYAHYNCLLAWIRSGHSLFGANFSSPNMMDAPVELAAADEWSQRAVHAFEFGTPCAAHLSPPPSHTRPPPPPPPARGPSFL